MIMGIAATAYLFGDNATEVANNAALPMCPIVYHD
jgi:hypothetical protein